jgi:hypothetical protein
MSLLSLTTIIFLCVVLKALEAAKSMEFDDTYAYKMATDHQRGSHPIELTIDSGAIRGEYLVG